MIWSFLTTFLAHFVLLIIAWLTIAVDWKCGRELNRIDKGLLAPLACPASWAYTYPKSTEPQFGHSGPWSQTRPQMLHFFIVCSFPVKAGDAPSALCSLLRRDLLCRGLGGCARSGRTQAGDGLDARNVPLHGANAPFLASVPVPCDGFLHPEAIAWLSALFSLRNREKRRGLDAAVALQPLPDSAPFRPTMPCAHLVRPGAFGVAASHLHP